MPYGYCPSTSAKAEAPPSVAKLFSPTCRPFSTERPKPLTTAAEHTAVVLCPSGGRG